MKYLLKLSLSFVSYNSILAAFSLVFSPEIAIFVETLLPYNGTITSGLFFMAFMYVDELYFT